MSHNYLFCWYSALLFCTHQWYHSRRTLFLIGIFLFLALIVLCRNSEVFCFLIPLLYNVNSRSEFVNRIRVNFREIVLLLEAAIPGILLLAVQLVYWKIVTGHFIYNGYQNNPGEALELSQPYFVEVLLSFRKGFLIYTPIGLFFIIGMYFLMKYFTTWRWSISLFSIINFWIIASWSCWWYSESFGQRAMIPMYAIWALGFSAFLQWISSLRIWYKLFFIAFLLAFTLLNLLQTWQVEKSILPPNWVSTEFYLSIFGQTSPLKPAQSELLLPKDDPGFKTELPEYFRNKLVHEFSCKLPKLDPNKLVQDSSLNSTALNKEIAYSEAIEIPNVYLNNEDYKWIYINASLSSSIDTNGLPVSLVIQMENKGKVYRWGSNNSEPVKWKKDSIIVLEGWYMVPKIKRKTDRLKAYVWSRSDVPVILHALNVELFRPKQRQRIFLWK